MKPYWSLSYSSLAVFTALAIIGCSPLNKSRTDGQRVPALGASVTPVSQSQSRLTTSVPNGDAYLSGAIQVVAVEFKKKNRRLGHGLEIRYPRIDHPRTRNEQNFNAYVRRLIEDQIGDFEIFCSKNIKSRDRRKWRPEYFLSTDFETLYATPELLSINITVQSFTGYVNADWIPVPINYDLRTGKPLKDVGALFKREAQFLKSIATYCLRELTERGTSCSGGGSGDKDLLRTGTQPNVENYRGWNLTRDGLKITFDEYQVGPGCLGLVKIVIPYDHLKEILRTDVQWFRIT